MESILSRLKTLDEGIQGSYVGKVSRAQANPDTNSRSEGEITFNFIGDDEKVVTKICSKVFFVTFFIAVLIHS
ncbi:hypothetical protein [Algoriphagus resistens]|uniref:hypothetical protein n=1 Tax=Algoriphagus resistens TaxID=1750590 RepID=UPI0009E66338|nr:hypothetical protein [Algoriphagus resistens]